MNKYQLRFKPFQDAFKEFINSNQDYDYENYINFMQKNYSNVKPYSLSTYQCRITKFKGKRSDINNKIITDFKKYIAEQEIEYENLHRLYIEIFVPYVRKNNVKLLTEGVFRKAYTVAD